MVRRVSWTPTPPARRHLSTGRRVWPPAHNQRRGPATARRRHDLNHITEPAGLESVPPRSTRLCSRPDPVRRRAAVSPAGDTARTSTGCPAPTGRAGAAAAAARRPAGPPTPRRTDTRLLGVISPGTCAGQTASQATGSAPLTDKTHAPTTQSINADRPHGSKYWKSFL